MISSHSSPLEDIPPVTSADALAGEFTVGLDLGQSFDPTAICVIRKLYGDTDRPIFQVGHLERLPLQTTYPGVVAHVGRLMQRLRGPSELVVDYTGVGRPVFDMFQAAGMPPIGISIHAGDAISNEGLIYKIPKLQLISRVQSLLHAGRLKIHKYLADAPALIAELQAFRAEVTNSGYWRFGARSGAHDDLVLALAVGLFRANNDAMQSWGVFEYYRQTYGTGAVDREPTALPPPLEPLPPEGGPNFGPTIGPQSVAQLALVTLKAPGAVSAATGLSGRLYKPNAAGCFRVTAEDAKPLVAHGWTRVAGQ